MATALLLTLSFLSGLALQWSFLDSHYLYLGLDLFTLSYPLAQSFEWRLEYYRKWKGLFRGILVAGTLFIIWDIAFTHMGVWGFNPRYLSGWYIGNLPVEEWLFFLVVPFACLFLYEVMNFYLKYDPFRTTWRPFSIALAVFLLATGIWHFDKWYTALTFIATGAYLLYLVYGLRVAWLSRFYIGYLVSLIPFLLVNGILTGSFIEDEVVWYNNTENLGIRIFTIPLEDSIYLLLLLLLVTTFYERGKARSAQEGTTSFSP